MLAREYEVCMLLIKIQRGKVTLAQLFRYVRQQCTNKGIDFYIERDNYEKPHTRPFLSLIKPQSLQRGTWNRVRTKKCRSGDKDNPRYSVG